MSGVAGNHPNMIGFVILIQEDDHSVPSLASKDSSVESVGSQNSGEPDDDLVGLEVKLSDEKGFKVGKKVITKKMMEESVRHVRNAKVQRKYLQDSVAKSIADVKIMFLILRSIIHSYVTIHRIWIIHSSVQSKRDRRII